MAIESKRRFYLLKRRAARLVGDCALEAVWQAKQEAEGGSALVAPFPSLSVLTDAGYSTVEDLNGAETQELVELGLSRRDAASVLAALAPLIA